MTKLNELQDKLTLVYKENGLLSAQLNAAKKQNDDFIEIIKNLSKK